jgi:uncharacterized protein YecE (DUF72 family)
LIVGTSGWSYPEWKRSIYRDVPQRLWLNHYSELFDAVEINLTYRRDLTPEMAERWVASTRTGFRFVIKAHQRATHFNRLREPNSDIPTQAAQARLLGDRLGLVYFQLPHNFVCDAALLEAFLEAWPPEVPVAWEFLHPSWHDRTIQGLLRRHQAAWVISDAKSPDPEFVTTSTTAYLRLREAEYDHATLAARAAAVRALDTTQTWIFVRHGSDAPDLARRFERSTE